MTSIKNLPTSSKRNVFRRLLLGGTTAGALMIAVTAYAGVNANGKNFTVKGDAKVGATIGFDGKGTFDATEEGDNVVFKTKAKRLDMGIRNQHYMGEDSYFGMQPGDEMKLTVAKSEIKFPEAGGKSNGNAKGTLSFGKGSQDVKIKYEVSEKDGKFTVGSGSFSFDHAKHTKTKTHIEVKKAGITFASVKPTVTVEVTNVVLNK